MLTPPDSAALWRDLLHVDADHGLARELQVVPLFERWRVNLDLVIE